MIGFIKYSSKKIRVGADEDEKHPLFTYLKTLNIPIKYIIGTIKSL